MARKNTRVILTVDRTYSRKCDVDSAQYVHRRESRTLADFERAAAVFMRDAEMTRLHIERRLAELRDEEERARALVRVAPLPWTYHE